MKPRTLLRTALLLLACWPLFASAADGSFMSRLFGGGSESRGGLDLCGATFERPVRREGRSWTVIAAHADIPLYNACKGNVTSGLASFRDTFYVLAEKDGRLLLGQWDSRDRKITAVTGWADRDTLVLGREARQPKGKLSFRKALIVNKGREGSAGEFREADAFASNSPAANERAINKLGVFQIYYVFTPPGLEDGDYELLGLVHALPSMRNARELLGWVPKRRILYWPHRQALEINKSPEALAERQRGGKPALAFGSLDHLRDFYKREVAGGAPLDARNRAALDRMGVVALERLSFAEPWPPYVNRWPILDSQARPQRQFGMNAYQVGVIGDIELRSAPPPTEGDATAPAQPPPPPPPSKRIQSEDFYSKQAKIQEILALYENVDILFVVDLTKSIRPFLPSIAAGIRQAMDEVRGRFVDSDFRPRIRFALAGFRDRDDREPFAWLSRREAGGSVEHFHQDVAYLQRQLDTAARRADSAVARYPENMLGAVRQALAEAKFTEPHSYRAVFVIGDAGSLGDPRDTSNSCFECQTARGASDGISRLLSERRVRLFPVQVRSPWTEQRFVGFREAAALFAAQAGHLRGLNPNWVGRPRVVPNESAAVTGAVVQGIFTGERESTLAQCVLQQIAQGNTLEYVREHPDVCLGGGATVGTDAAATGVDGKPATSAGENELIYGVVLMVGDVIRQTISDDEFIRQNRIQAFDTGFVLQRHPELKHDYVKPVVLMSLPDLQRLVGILAHVTDQPLRPRDLGRIWKAAVASELGDEARDQSESYYAAMEILDIPVQSEILKRPFSDFNEDSGNLTEEELDRLYLLLRDKWERLSNIFHGGKKNFFTIYQRDYTWIPVSLLP